MDETCQLSDESTRIRVRKRQLRRSMLARRRGLSAAQRLAYSRRIWERLAGLSCFQQAKLVLGYMAFDHEVLTDGLMRQTMQSGKQWVLPMVQIDQQNMVLYAVEDLERDVAPGYHGILEPQAQRTRTVEPEAIELALIPGVAFDLRGGRLGFGVGFYDRLLPRFSENVATLGLAFDFQVIPRLPSEPHDVMLDGIVTERRLVWGRGWANDDKAAGARFSNVAKGRGEG